ncbi:MAG TPA: glycoside hydrolase family 38 C-terminal domain-containing protein [Bryobacteraceae bacterium]|nr:glycoside hydrolase family 38 C-terminal domain-containing protein [Bryobacteraceae bacterium]
MRGHTLLRFALALPVIAALAFADAPVWRIGKFDHTSAEFHGREAGTAPVIKADAPDAAAHWPADQAGSGNVKAGSKAHPRIIHFTLHGAPSGAYTLVLSVLAGNPRVPRLDLDLNGTPGSAYLDRKLTYFAEGRMDSPINGEAHVRINVPAALLHAGQNALTITAVDDSPDVTGDSSIEWDALELTHDAGATPSAMGVEVTPTYFYVRKNGELCELVDVTLSLAGVSGPAALTLTVAGKEYPAGPAAGRFGQQRFEFAIPEFAADTAATVAATLGSNRTEHTARLTPKRKFTVYVVPHNHLDIGFTDYQPKIEELQNRNFDRLLEEMRTDALLRFSLDGVWPAEQYLRTRSEPARKEFLDRVRSGRIAIPAQYANLMMGGADLETLVRSLYDGKTVNRGAGVDADYANITDVPAYPWSYASVLHAAGVKYFAAGANDDRGPQPLYGRWQTHSPFWWQGPDGAKVLMAYTRQYSQLWFVCGLPPQEAGCREGLPTLFQTYEAPGYVPDKLLMFGSQLENTDLIPGEGKFVESWNTKYAWPKLQLATFRDYFQVVEREFGDKLETVRGDFGPYWEDGIGADSQVAAQYREAESRAASAETLASVAAELEPQFAAPLDRLHRIWHDLMLYAEHTYTSWGGYSRPDSNESVEQIATKRFYVADAHEQNHWLTQEAMSRLLDNIAIEPPALVVFNSLGHARDALAEVDLDNGTELVDAASGKAVPLETVRSGEGYRHVRFLAEHVPALGYRVYRMQPSRSAPALEPGNAANTIENRFYRVTVDPARGGVTSIFDKQAQREIVDAHSPYLLDQYLYVTGGDGTRIVYMRDHLPDAKLEITAAKGGGSAMLRATPWGQALTYKLHGRSAREITTEIRLYNDAKKIEFVNRVEKEPFHNKEAIYFAFPFAAADPRFEYEGQTGIVNPAHDSLAGANREWFTVGHWARVSGGGISAAIIPEDGPLATFGDIDRGLWPHDFAPKSSTIFAYALNNYWHTNFPRVQSGDFTFRYVLSSGADLDPASLSRLGREVLTPLETGELISNDKVGMRGSLPATEGAFLGVDGKGAEVETLKPAEDGRGYVMRLLETSGRAHSVSVASGLFQIDRVWETSAVEDDRREVALNNHAVAVDLPANGIVTLRLLLSYTPKPAAPVHAIGD